MEKYEEDIVQIHSMMERSARFISLSGISGIITGIIALIGAAFAYYFFAISGLHYFEGHRSSYPESLMKQLFIVAILTLIAALIVSIF